MILGYGKVISRIIYLGWKKEPYFIDFGFSPTYIQNIIAFPNSTVNTLTKFTAVLSIKHVAYILRIGPIHILNSI